MDQGFRLHAISYVDKGSIGKISRVGRYKRALRIGQRSEPLIGTIHDRTNIYSGRKIFNTGLFVRQLSVFENKYNRGQRRMINFSRLPGRRKLGIGDRRHIGEAPKLFLGRRKSTFLEVSGGFFAQLI